MQIEFNVHWLLMVFYSSIRLGALLLFSPLFSSLNGLVTVRVLLTLALSTLLVSSLHLTAVTTTLSLGAIVATGAAELIVGLVMAFGVLAAFAAFSVAGKLLDVQSGLGLGAVYDPVTRADAPLFATLLNMVAAALFFGLDAHHALLRGLAFSLRQIPLGTGFDALRVEPIVRQFGVMFSFGVALIIPVLLCLLLTETGLAIAARALPQMNIFVVGVPVKIVVTLSVLAASLGALQPVMVRVYAAIFDYWEQVLN